MISIWLESAFMPRATAEAIDDQAATIFALSGYAANFAHVLAGDSTSPAAGLRSTATDDGSSASGEIRSSPNFRHFAASR
jgi:hypothetical protein